MSQHRNLDIAGKTPALGLGAPTNYLKKKVSLVWPAQILVTKAKVCANLFVLQSLWISFDSVLHGAHKSTDDGWHTPGDAPLAPPSFTFHAAIFLAAVFECKYATGILGFTETCLQTARRTGSGQASGYWTTGRASTVETNDTWGCPSRPAVIDRCVRSGGRPHAGTSATFSRKNGRSLGSRSRC